jgi:hypothetical protein
MDGRVGRLSFFIVAVLLLVGFGGAENGTSVLQDNEQSINNIEESATVNNIDNEGEGEILVIVPEADLVEVDESLVDNQNESVLVVDENESGSDENESFLENESVLVVNENESNGCSENESFLENESLAEIENVSIDENVSSGFEYINIDELINETPEKILIEDKREKILKELVKDGMIELEFKILEGDDIQIVKKEMGRGKFEKDVLISSDEHFDDEVRVYSDLPSSAKRKDIVVIWESEGEVVGDVEYFDLDEDGLIERISWIVPHLSTQHYSIEIVTEEIVSSSEEIILSIDAPANESTVLNPISFNISIDYSNLSNVECWLQINDGDLYSLVEGEDVFSGDSGIELSSGPKNWVISCNDKYDKNITVSASGFFDVFDFKINGMDDFYFNNSNVSGSVDSQGDFELKLRKGDNEEIIHHTTGDFLIEKSKISSPGNYELIASSSYYDGNISVSKNFSVGFASVRFLDENIELGETAPVELYIDSQGFSGNYYLWSNAEFVGGTGIIDSEIVNINNFKPNGDGVYSLSLNVLIDNVQYSFGGLNDLVVGAQEDVVDNTDPDISLIFPSWEDEVDGDEIVFKYRVNEDNGIDNCSLNLYNAKKDSSGVYQTDDLVFPISPNDEALAFEDGLSDGEEIEIRLIDFDDNEDYIWEVRCYDNAGNEGWDFNYFSMKLGGDEKVSSSEANYSRKSEVEDLINKINSFLEKEEDFNLEERRILDILGLSSDMVFYKKRIIQMDQDLKFNLKFMESVKREKRIAEINKEIDEIKEKIVLNVVSLDSYEFSKGSVDLDLGTVIGDYMEAIGTEISGSALGNLVKYNEGLQRSLGVSVEAWRLELEYLDETREIVLVSKNIEITASDETVVGGLQKADDFIVLEVLPKGKDIVFVSDIENMGNDIYSVDVSNLKEGNLVYYFNEGFALKEVEKMESVLFGEGVNGGLSITGMFVGVGDSLNIGSFFWLPLFLFFGYFGVLIFGKVRLEGWKKEPGVEEMVRLINETGVLLREGRVNVARDNYKRMGEIYKALPVKCRDFFYGEIKRVRLSIDKKDVLGLIKEYEDAKDSFRKDDAIALHGKINAIYRKLPRKFQEKIYRRLVKKEI